MKEIIEIVRKLKLPPLYAQEQESDPVLYLRFSLIGFSWAWYASEAQVEENDVLFFGFVTGDEHEFGYFRLSELCSASLPLRIDSNFAPMKFSEAKKIYGFRLAE